MTYLNLELITKRYTEDDYNIRSNGKKFINAYIPLLRPLLNLTSEIARSDMLGFVGKVVLHLNILPMHIRKRIKLIVPTFTPDDETELPFHTFDDSTKTIVINELSGFSKPEVLAFMKFLKERYQTINSLNISWGEGAKFTDFDSTQIQIKRYQWSGIKVNSSAKDYYKYE